MYSLFNIRRSADEHLPTYPMKIMLKGRHNHWSNCVANVCNKDVSKDTKKKIVDLYVNSYSPYSALDIRRPST